MNIFSLTVVKPREESIDYFEIKMALFQRSAFGLKVRMSKTEYMASPTNDLGIKMEGEDIPTVENSKYLSKFSSDS